MKYSDNIDYLLASIVYLGTHTYWWARSPQSMAMKLRLEEHQLEKVFDGFPGIFRRSVRTDTETKQHYYSLQARYAQKKGGDTEDPNQASYIDPVSSDTLQVLINFVLKMVEQEQREAEQELRVAEREQSRKN
jgi:hypothetical protein